MSGAGGGEAGAVLGKDLARQFLASTLGHLTRQWPHSRCHVLSGPQDLALPAIDHPIFHGSFDWHSCVHGWWQVMRLRRLFPDLPEAVAVGALAERMFTSTNGQGELDYFLRPGSAAFERPYGWAWLLALHAELTMQGDGQWADAIAPLAHLIAARFRSYLSRLTHPVRHGNHANTAFALVLLIDWAELEDPALATFVREKVIGWFGADADVRPLEPSGEDFLSPTLCAALAMSRAMAPGPFVRWFANYLPTTGDAMSHGLDLAMTVSDRTDGRLAHLDGLNLSRAWCLRELTRNLGWSFRPAAIDALIAATLPHIADDYMGEHWLATFAVLSLTGASRRPPPLLQPS